MDIKMEKVLRFAKNISICHIYSKKKSLTILDSLSDKFGNYISMDVYQNDTLPKESNIFIAEINAIDKELFKTLQKISNTYQRSHFYIFSNMADNPTLLKFCIAIGAKNIYSDKVDMQTLIKILDRAIKKVAIDTRTYNLAYLGEQLDRAYPVIIFVKNRVAFANSSAKKYFGTESTSIIEKIVRKNKDLYSLIDKKVSTNIFITIDNGKNEYNEQMCSIVYNQEEQKSILSILVNKNLMDDELAKLTQNRFAFIEKLKDKIVQNKENQKDIFLTLISIDNGEKIKNSFSKVEYFNFLKDFILQINRLKNSSEKIVEWSQNLFVLMYENTDFKKMKNDMALLHNSIVNGQKDSKFAPIITTSFFSLQGKELNSVIDFIDKIDKRDSASIELMKENYYEYKYLNDTLDEKEQIKHLLQNCINNNISVKLLNIYKGLCVNTEAKVLKQADDFFYLSCEKLQRYIIKIDNETIIQSPTFPYDIKAVVKFIDINKNYIIVEKLSFLKNSANNRQHTRVQPTVRIPIAIKKDKFVKYGEVLDISINAVAIKTKQKIDESFMNSNVNLNFKLPDDKSEDGFANIDIEATIKMIMPYDETHYKVVAILNASDGSDSKILKYVYLRQKELIEELKKAIKYG